MWRVSGGPRVPLAARVILFLSVPVRLVPVGLHYSSAPAAAARPDTNIIPLHHGRAQRCRQQAACLTSRFFLWHRGGVRGVGGRLHLGSVGLRDQHEVDSHLVPGAEDPQMANISRSLLCIVLSPVFVQITLRQECEFLLLGKGLYTLWSVFSHPASDKICMHAGVRCVSLPCKHICELESCCDA